MSAIAWERWTDGLAVRSSELSMRLSWIAPGIVRIGAVPAGAGDPVCAYGPMLDPECGLRPAPFEIRQAPSEIVTSDGVLTVHIDTSTGAFTYRDARGRLLLQDTKTLQPRPVPGEGYRARLDLGLPPGAALYGLGQHEDGRLDYRGREQELYQHNLKSPVPFLLSTGGWGLLWHGYSAMTYRDDGQDAFLLADCVAEIDYFVIAGATLDDVIGGYRGLTGAAPLPPRWAFGFVQSKERYQTQEELLDVAHRYARLGLTADCLMLDWQCWPDEQWGQKSLDPKRFPDPVGMCRQLHQLGTRLMMSIWPELNNGGPNELELRAAGKMLADGHTYDAFDPEARAIYWRQAHDGLFVHGIDAWWADSCEPFQADWHGTVQPSPAERRRLNVELAEKHLGPAVSNAYPLMHNSGIWEGQRGSGSDKRVVIVTRSAWGGQQRYGTFVWSGDVSATWDTLRRQIPEGLNFCASGLPYWNCDIGGFFAGSRDEWFWKGDYDSGVADPGYRELFLRWFQYGTFLPMMRVHGTDTPREIWHFGEPGTPVYDALVRFIRLRKDLMPYLYSVAAAVHFEGYTMMRALGFDFAGDPAAVGVEDQFMLGPALMVCPVTAPGATSRPVYLPAGTTWVDVWDGTVHEGGTRIDAAVSLDTIPVFARAGSILPLEHGVLVFPGADGTFIHYEDAGDGWGYETGEYLRITIRWNDTDRVLTVGPSTGSYPGAPAARHVEARLVQPGSGWRPEDAYTEGAEAEYRSGYLRLRL